MAILRLFHRDRPFQPIGERRLGGGLLVVGRGDEADWILPDPSKQLSRRHCRIAVVDGGVAVRDLSTNGVFVGPDETPAPRDEDAMVAVGETIRLGDFMVIVEADQDEDRRERPAVATIGGPRPPAHFDGAALLEAFCDGARIDASRLADASGEDLMRRAGAIYRQMVVGLTDLMASRTIAKAEYQLDRTAVHAAGNNPFRWAGAERTASDLLLARQEAFLGGSAAVVAAFQEVQNHIDGLIAGADAALKALIDDLHPDRVQSSAPKGLPFGSGAAGAWKAYCALHARHAKALAHSEESAPRRAFSMAYQGRARGGDAPSRS